MRLRAAERFDLLRALLFGRAEALGQLRGSAGAEAAGLSLLLSGFLVILREQEGRSRAGESDGTRTAFLLSLSLYCGTFILFFLFFCPHCVRSVASSLGNSMRVGESVGCAERS